MGRLSDRYKGSLQQLDYARRWTPTGAQTISKAPERFCLGAYPVYLDRGLGAYVIDIDGHQYLDMICGLACMTLGYSRPEIEAAVCDQLYRGISFSLATKLESELAERLCGIFPCGKDGSVRWVKTGSEAAEGAIRIARRATGRDIIVTVKDGYHAWHSWFSAVKDSHPGVPRVMETLVRGFKYNDLDSLDRVLDSDVAAVIMEPTLNERPDEGFLQAVREKTKAIGALLIFDEVVCAGRWAPGGGQEYFSVYPDMATAGKGLANGMPLGCIIGSRDIMAFADCVSGTFGGEALSLAACNAVLDIYKNEKICETLWALGYRFQHGFNDLAHVLGFDGDPGAICDGFAVKPRIRFRNSSYDDIYTGETNINAMSLFLQETAVRGVLWHPAGGNISAAMTPKDIDMALVAMGEALAIVKKSVENGDWSVLEGRPIQPVSMVRKG